MMYLTALACLVAALPILAALAAIDLKHYILPNKLVGGFAVLGIGFHTLTEFAWLSPVDMVLGALVGGGILFAIRFVANHIAKDDTLGLGDVKLLAAAGLWLGLNHVLLAMVLGALAGLVHGLGVSAYQKYKTGAFASLTTLTVPAGPGFILGILAAGLYKFAGTWP